MIIEEESTLRTICNSDFSCAVYLVLITMIAVLKALQLLFGSAPHAMYSTPPPPHFTANFKPQTPSHLHQVPASNVRTPPRIIGRFTRDHWQVFWNNCRVGPSADSAGGCLRTNVVSCGGGGGGGGGCGGCGGGGGGGGGGGCDGGGGGGGVAVGLTHLHRDYADAVRLFKFFKMTEGAGGVGGFITCLFFIAIMLFGSALLVFYGFAIYKNGAIMDAIWRLYGDERNFFLPYDTEIDAPTLTNLIERAQKYRGKTGVTRKVVVTDLSVKVMMLLHAVACECLWRDGNACCLQMDADHAHAFSRQSDASGSTVRLQEKELLQLTCIINVKPGERDVCLCSLFAV
jgi:hypothetical protein